MKSIILRTCIIIMVIFGMMITGLMVFLAGYLADFGMMMTGISAAGTIANYLLKSAGMARVTARKRWMNGF